MNMMNHINSVILEGNLTRDAEVREPNPGFRVATFPVATDRAYRNREGQLVEDVSFFDVKAYGEMVDYCADSGKKGTAVRVIGRLKQNRWKDEGGNPHSKVYIIAQNVELMPRIAKKESWAEALKAHEAARSSAKAADYASAARAQNETKPVESHEDAVF